MICQLLFPVCQTVWWSVCPSWPAAYLPLYDGCNKKSSICKCQSYGKQINQPNVRRRCVTVIETEWMRLTLTLDVWKVNMHILTDRNSVVATDTMQSIDRRTATQSTMEKLCRIRYYANGNITPFSPPKKNRWQKVETITHLLIDSCSASVDSGGFCNRNLADKELLIWRSVKYRRMSHVIVISIPNKSLAPTDRLGVLERPRPKKSLLFFPAFFSWLSKFCKYFPNRWNDWYADWWA